MYLDKASPMVKVHRKILNCAKVSKLIMYILFRGLFMKPSDEYNPSFDGYKRRNSVSAMKKELDFRIACIRSGGRRNLHFWAVPEDPDSSILSYTWSTSMALFRSFAMGAESQ